MDYLVPVGEEIIGEEPAWNGAFSPVTIELFDLYDFKYSNNAKSYAVSGQLHEYKYWYELTHPATESGICIS